ncbi:hypothetical protein ACFO3J_30935 [Streptomyces polygonati]|uniref:Uncharacterized protein n=1 Tax=Streptomyces polygonati TaxID=1617087 RepID=A0ABV8HXV8_9ACTN
MAPDAQPWTAISDVWPETVHFASELGGGIEEFEMVEVLRAIAAELR